MFETILEIAIHTPWWVYLLLVVLIKIGIKSSKTAIVSIHKLCIAPIIFTGMAIESLTSNLHPDHFVLGIFISTFILGIALGWLIGARQPLRFDQKNKLIEIPGSWSVMALIIVIFTAKYYFGYELSRDPKILENTLFEIAFIGVSAICTGFFVGKFICYLKRMLSEPSIDLTI